MVSYDTIIKNGRWFDGTGAPSAVRNIGIRAGHVVAVDTDVLVKGGDWKPENVVGADVVTARGGRVVIADFVAGHSTTGVVEKIRASMASEAASPGGAGRGA